MAVNETMQQCIDACTACVRACETSREGVFDGIATAEGLDGWFTKGSEVDARTGGHLRFRWRE